MRLHFQPRSMYSYTCMFKWSLTPSNKCVWKKLKHGNNNSWCFLMYWCLAVHPIIRTSSGLLQWNACWWKMPPTGIYKWQNIIAYIITCNIFVTHQSVCEKHNLSVTKCHETLSWDLLQCFYILLGNCFRIIYGIEITVQRLYFGLHFFTNAYWVICFWMECRIDQSWVYCFN